LIIENIYPITATSGGGFIVSFLIGYFIKKVVKILMFVLGGILTLLMYLQFQDIVNVNIKVDKFQSTVDAIINTILTNATAMLSNDNNPYIENNLAIPISGSVTAGFVLGLPAYFSLVHALIWMDPLKVRKSVHFSYQIGQCIIKAVSGAPETLQPSIISF
jgi:uncharacterized membrane protein (Fun14 family)